ncbi:hypothetical protein BGW80DRAFT_1286430 [Lactifluus volemus]|nr:hypothetical protein BGW80DRAFT_1286430 [Lactifluus volemus]
MVTNATRNFVITTINRPLLLASTRQHGAFLSRHERYASGPTHRCRRSTRARAGRVHRITGLRDLSVFVDTPCHKFKCLLPKYVSGEVSVTQKFSIRAGSMIAKKKLCQNVCVLRNQTHSRGLLLCIDIYLLSYRNVIGPQSELRFDRRLRSSDIICGDHCSVQPQT